MPDLIPINILIGDRTYRIRTNPDDEEFIRKTLKTINDKILEFKTAYAGKDMQDYIAMVVIWFATEVANRPGSTPDNMDITAILSRIEQAIDPSRP